jgi:hypothetical protein
MNKKTTATTKHIKKIKKAAASTAESTKGPGGCLPIN